MHTQVIDSDDEKDVYEWSPEIRLADYYHTYVHAYIHTYIHTQVIDSDDEKDVYGWSPEIRLADYKKDVKRQEKQDAEKKKMERDRDPMRAAEEEARANRQFFKAG